MNNKVLYIGGFELPDRNAAAQRVIGMAKCFSELGYSVEFLNSLKNSNYMQTEIVNYEAVNYYGFKVYEYKRESEFDYLILGATAIKYIQMVKPGIVIAYNYPSISLDRIRKYCKRNKILCIADATEWYKAIGGSFVYRIIKNADTFYRMHFVQKRLDGVIAISKYLYDYYHKSVKTVLIPPIIDISDEKWNSDTEKNANGTVFVYAGMPVSEKEKLDVIVNAISIIAQSNRVSLHVVGITEEQFRELYKWKSSISPAIKFFGRVEHEKAIEIVKNANWAIIIRENNRLVKAGFPTKLVEAISCGTPIIANKFSNIDDYLNEDNCILISNYDEINDAIIEAIHKNLLFDRREFDYHYYVKDLGFLLNLENSNN